jgi:hypothetical protein
LVDERRGRRVRAEVESHRRRPERADHEDAAHDLAEGAHRERRRDEERDHRVVEAHPRRRRLEEVGE